MNLELLKGTWDLDLPSGPKLVLIALCDHADDKGECFPSLERLAKRCSMSLRAARYHIAELERVGVITRSLRSGRSTRFTVHPGRFCTPADFAPTPADFAPTPADFAGTPADFAGIRIQEEYKEQYKESALNARAHDDSHFAFGRMAAELRAKGVKVSSAHPALIAWVTDGYSVGTVMEAVAMVRMSKPEPEVIHANYLDRVLRDSRRVSGGLPRASPQRFGSGKMDRSLAAIAEWLEKSEVEHEGN